jgi:hypothetical protein
MLYTWSVNGRVNVMFECGLWVWSVNAYCKYGEWLCRVNLKIACGELIWYRNEECESGCYFNFMNMKCECVVCFLCLDVGNKCVVYVVCECGMWIKRSKCVGLMLCMYVECECVWRMLRMNLECKCVLWMWYTTHSQIVSVKRQSVVYNNIMYF